MHDLWWRIAKLRCWCCFCFFFFKKKLNIHTLCWVMCCEPHHICEKIYRIKNEYLKNRCFSSDSFLALRAECMPANVLVQQHALHPEWYQMSKLHTFRTKVQKRWLSFGRDMWVNHRSVMMNFDQQTENKKKKFWCVESIRNMELIISVTTNFWRDNFILIVGNMDERRTNWCEGDSRR